MHLHSLLGEKGDNGDAEAFDTGKRVITMKDVIKSIETAPSASAATDDQVRNDLSFVLSSHFLQCISCISFLKTYNVEAFVINIILFFLGGGAL